MKRLDAPLPPCDCYFGKDGYCLVGDQCEKRHGEDAVVIFSTADLEKWELEEKRAIQSAKERHEYGKSKFKALEFHTVHPNYDTPQRRPQARPEVAPQAARAASHGPGHQAPTAVGSTATAQKSHAAQQQLPKQIPDPAAGGAPMEARRPEAPAYPTPMSRMMRSRAAARPAPEIGEKRQEQDPAVTATAPASAPGTELAGDTKASEVHETTAGTVTKEDNVDPQPEAHQAESAASVPAPKDPVPAEEAAEVGQGDPKRPRLEEAPVKDMPAVVLPESDAVGTEALATDTAAADERTMETIATGVVREEAVANEPSQPSGVPTRQQADDSNSVQTQTSVDDAKKEDKAGEKTDEKKAEQPSHVVEPQAKPGTDQLPAGVRKDNSGVVKPVVDLRQQCPIPWKTRQAMAERFAEYLAQRGVAPLDACVKAVKLELELVEGSSSPLDYRSCAAALMLKLRSEYEK